MASDSGDEEDYVVLGTIVPEVFEDQPKKPINPQDLTAKDKQGRRRFHGAFTGGFSAGFFNTVGTKEGFIPSTFVSSKSKKHGNDAPGSSRPSQPEDFMDEEDLEEHGIAPRKFATVGNFSSEERKRKQITDSNQVSGSSELDITAFFDDLVVPEQLTIGVKLLRKMGWKEGQGLGPRIMQKKKKKKKTQPKSGVKVYGCAPPPSDESDSAEEFIPEDMSSVTFAPKDVAPISVTPKDNVHGLGYKGLDPSLALPSSHINLFSAPPVRSKGSRKGISGQAFGVGAFEDEDEDIYTVDNLSNYDITMQPDNQGDDKFGWTAPKDHGKQTVPVNYVGKLLEGFCLSKTQLKPKKKFTAPTLPRGFKPHHWFRKYREMSHIPEHLKHRGDNNSSKLNAVDRGILLGEQPLMRSVFDLIPKADQERIDATKEAISMTKSLNSIKDFKDASLQQDPPENEGQKEENFPSASTTTARNFSLKFQPAMLLNAEAQQDNAGQESRNTPLFQNSMTFQPFRKDPVKQSRYEKYLSLLKQGAKEPYNVVAASNMTEWEKARERDEFSKAAKMFRPMSAMMSSRFVSGAMIDDDMEEKHIESGSDKTDEAKAAEMKMFGKLTREEHEWHPHQLLCKRFNVPNPFPGSDIVGIPGVKRDKYSVFNFLSVGDFQSGETQEPSSSSSTEPPGVSSGGEVSHSEKTMFSTRSKKATMASVFKVLDDPNFHKSHGSHESITPSISSTGSASLEAKDGASTVDHHEAEDTDNNNEEEPNADMDLFRAIFKNSDSDDSEKEEDNEGIKDVETSSEDEHSSPDVQLESRTEASVQEKEESFDVKTEKMDGVEVIQDSFRPLFTRRKKVNVDQEAHCHLQERLQEAVPEIPSSSTEMQATDKLPQRRSYLGAKSVFSVLENMEENDGFKSKEVVTISKQHSGEKEVFNDIAGVETETYGPSLPPVTIDRLASPSANKEINNDERNRPLEKLEKRSSRKESRSSHRKDKRKKSKHKKQKKHRKHKRSSKSRGKSKKDKHSSSGSEADTESDSDDSVSDSELLERLRDVSKSTKSLEKIQHL